MPDPSRPRPDASRGRFALACGLGALVGLAVVVLIAAQIGIGPGTRHFSDDFFDAQARAWLGGHWDVPAGVVGIEGYATDHGMQMYFGVLPALLRLPVLLVTDRLDGSLTLPSLLAAFAVVALATSRLLWSARVLLDRERAPGRPAAGGWFADVVAGLLVALVTGASTVTFLAAQPTVYTEAVLWGVALSLASADLLVRHLRHPRTATLVGAAALAAAAVNARISTGAGAVVAVGAVAVLVVLGPGPAGSVRDRLRRSVGLGTGTTAGTATTGTVGTAEGGPTADDRAPGHAAARRPDHVGRRGAAVALGLVVLGTVVLAGANTARFGSPFGIPYAQQVPYRTQPERRAELERTGSLFAPKYVVGNVLTYLRPDGVQLEPAPAVTFLDTADNARWLTAPPNLFEPTASAPASMPGLVVLAGAGVVVLAGHRRRDAARAFRLPVAGAAAGTLFVFAFASLAHRYTGDLVPVLVLLGALGAARAGAATGRPARAGVAAGLVLALLWGAWAQAGLTMTIALRSSLRTDAALARWAGVLTDLERRVDPDAVVERAQVPPAAVGWWRRVADPDCNRVYVVYDGSWYAVDHRPDTGAFHLSTSPPPADGREHVLVSADDGRTLVGLRAGEAGPVLVASTDGGGTWTAPSGRGGRRADGADVPQVLPVVDGRVEVWIDADPWLRRLTAGGADPDSFAVLRLGLDEAPRAVALTPDPGLDVRTLADRPFRCEEWTRPAA